jgi:hypothetical protein
MTGGVARQFSDRDRERLVKMTSRLGSANGNEFTAARGRIDAMLGDFGKTWADLIALLGGKPDKILVDIVEAVTNLGSDDPDVLAKARRLLNDLIALHSESWAGLVNELRSVTPADWVSKPAPPAPDRVNPLALVYHLIGEYVDLREHERIAASLWGFIRIFSGSSRRRRGWR